MAMVAVLPGHKAGAAQNFPYVEYDVMESPLLSVLGTPKLNTDGTINLPDGPGLGFEMKPEQLQPWLKEHWVEEGISPSDVSALATRRGFASGDAWPMK